ncbi:MMPL family transporter [Mycolicibacterium sp. YH-1]|uniref:MMPL family transporter n=1 Tax=Mycolicibacterium sp. YH-1 TaxID=2908837 RepID=UPI001F4C377C|nr:MMPL family transporter [Mycolicibacterium sp. YH-1]UNB54595.1 MMPL family transporter [Mycolicibacterium sp. YH-1]
MSFLLYRVGGWCYRHRWVVLAGWLVLICGVAAVLVTSPPTLSNEIRIDGTPAQEVLDDLAVKVPESVGGQGIIALQSDGGRIDEGARLTALLSAVDGVYTSPHVLDARSALAGEIAKGPQSHLLQATAAVSNHGDTQQQPGSSAQPLVVDGQPVPGVSISADGRTALLQFAFDQQTFELPEGTVDHVIAATENAVAGHGIAALPSAAMFQIPDIIGVAEVIGVGVAAVVLTLTLGSLVAAGLPLASALAGVVVGVGGTLALSNLVAMHSLTVVLGLMIGLAVGIDYALFVVNRQRRFILDHQLDAHHAASRAIGTTGSAVVFAGATVIIALLALTVVGIPLLTTMALAAAATVAIAVLASLTLLPALLGCVGERTCTPTARQRAAATSAARGSAHRFADTWSRIIVKHRLLAIAASVGIAGLLAIPALNMNLGLPSGASYHPDTAQRQSFDVVAEAFGPGFNGPLVVVATHRDDAPLPPAATAAIAKDLHRIDGVAAVTVAGAAADGRTVLYSVIPETGPTSPETADIVTALRDDAATIAAHTSADIGVTGFTALGIDVSDKLADVLPVYLAVVVGLSLVILLVVFRSILIPLKATLGFLLSIGAAFGATTALFQWGWLQPLFGMHATTPVLCLLPIIATGVLYGLAMDYEVFLVSSMKEAHTHGEHGQRAVIRGFGMAGKVVAAAAIIMTSVFAGFIFNPEPMIAQVGFTLAFGILVDAFLVRMTLVPAVMAALGDKAWWLPAWLDRLLPDLDIDGNNLQRRLTDATTEYRHRRSDTDIADLGTSAPLGGGHAS